MKIWDIYPKDKTSWNHSCLGAIIIAPTEQDARSLISKARDESDWLDENLCECKEVIPLTYQTSFILLSQIEHKDEELSPSPYVELYT